MSAPAAARPRAHPLLDLTLTGRPWLGRLSLAAVLGATAIGSSVALTATSGWLLSRAAQHPPVLTLMVAIVGVRFFGLARGVLRYAERLVSHDAAFRLLGELRVRVFTALEPLTPAGLGTYRSGDLLSRLVDDVDVLQDLWLRVLLPCTCGALVGVGASVGVGLASPAAGLALASGLAAAALWLPWWVDRRSRTAEGAARTAEVEVTAGLLDGVEGAWDLVSCDAVEGQLGRIRDAGSRWAAARFTAARVAGAGAGLTVALSGATTLACAVLGVAAVRRGTLPGVLLATVVLTPTAAFEAVGGFASAAQQLGRLRVSARRLLGVLDAGAEATALEARERTVRHGDADSPADRPRADAGTVSLERIDARWPGAGEAALRGIDLDLRPGRRVAVVGPSGAGKSTLVAVLLGFVAPDAGRVAVDGVDARALDPELLRSHVAWCDQGAHVFDASIGANVRVGRPEASDDQVRRALARAQLLDWVDALPVGLDTPVGEHGRALSGGQRQRLALARALVSDRPILLLDEPTEHVEEELGDQLVADLLAAAPERATLLVTHRLSGMEPCDEIVVLVDGSIAQRGRHAELVSRPGWYADAWHQQH